jgi:hypothetical protein
MSDAIRAYLDHRELGRIERRVGLNGRVPLDGAGNGAPELCMTPDELWLVAARDQRRGTAIALLDRAPRYEPGRLRDRLRVGELELVVPAGKSGAVLELIGIARLRRSGARRELTRPPARHVQPLDSVTALWLARELEPGETLLVWLRGKETAPVSSDVLLDAQGSVFLMVTDRRAALVILSAAGDERIEAIDAGVEIAAQVPALRTRLREWQPARSGAELGREALAALRLPSAEHALELLRSNFVTRREEPERAHLVTKLLGRGAELGGATERITAWLADAELLPERRRGGPIAAIDELASEQAPTDLLGQIWRRWELTREAGLDRVEALRSHAERAEPWALELHQVVHENTPSPNSQADIALAEHQIAAHRPEAAAALLTARLRRLPSEALEDLLPPSDADLTRGDAGQALRIRVHELLAQIHEHTPTDSGRAISLRSTVELARLQPLVTQRIAKLCELAEDELAERAASIFHVMEPGGLTPRDTATPAFGRPLSRESIEHRLRHPAARAGDPLLGRLQTLIAAVPSPDHGLLRDYCERLSSEKHGGATRALRRAATVLGIETEAYISRGSKSVGIRAYDGKKSFVLIGGQHLEPDGPRALSESEFAFVLGTELAHLKLGHTPVTSSEVWSGAFTKTRDGLDLVFGLLPLLKGLRFADKASQMLSSVPAEKLRRIVMSADRLGLLPRLDLHVETTPSDDDVLSRVHEELVAAHRVMQLTADRAGLLVAGNVAAALRAVLLARPDYAELAEAVENDGLGSVLARRNDAGQISYQELAIRVAALLSFFLSDDYERLRQEAGLG